MRVPAVSFLGIGGLPEIAPGHDLAAEILAALQRMACPLQDRDILVVAQKVVSKREARWVDLDAVTPGAEAIKLGERTHKDPRFVEVVLRESSAVVRAARNVLITRHRLGFVMANAGIDRSNISAGPCSDRVLLLPADPDGSARELCDALRLATGCVLAVIVSDSFGRPWRNGVVNVALGVSGMAAVHDLRGTPDRAGRVMETTQVAVADAVAAGAALAMGEAGEGVPVVLARGIDWTASAANGQTLIRPLEEDLFR